MRKALAAIILALLPSVVMAHQVPEESPEGGLSGELVIEGTGDSRRLIRAIERRFEELHPGAHIEIPTSVGSSGGIWKLVKGETELVRTARPLSEEEMGYGFTSRVFAISPLVFAVHPRVKGIDNLTYEQIVDIYKKEITDWSQLSDSSGKIYFISRESEDSSRSILEDHIPGFAEIVPPTFGIFYTTQETVDAMAEHENTIGYGPISMIIETNLKILKLNGVYPSAENVKNGRYELAIPFSVVYREGGLGPLAAAFVDFLYGPESGEIIRRYGCLPVERD